MAKSTEPKRKTGVWFIGAKGGVATTTILGLLALRKSLTGNTGLVSQLPHFNNLDLIGWNDVVIGGHDIRETTLIAEARKLQTESRIFDEHVLGQCLAELEDVDRRIHPGVVLNVGQTILQLATTELQALEETAANAIERVKQDLQDFATSNALETVLVINLASTEPSSDIKGLPETWDSLSAGLAKNSIDKLPSSSLYAIAALDLGFPYVNFTPSVGSALPAINNLAVQRDTCHMGHDGKTGETLLKSALAPMFANRNLEIMSWVGHNIFGNMDGQVLDNPENKKTKVDSKDKLLSEVLGYDPQSHISIEYIKSLGDWKTAWDHIHFKGFLGTPMTMQFTWQGCDSILAAPLVIDLIRFTELSHRNGEVGLLTHLASFFKSPIGVRENNFELQFQMLLAWAAGMQENASA